MKKLIRPSMATLITKPFNPSGWVNEEKYDGFWKARQILPDLRGGIKMTI